MLIFESHSEMMLWDGGQPVLQPQSVCFRRVGKPKASMFDESGMSKIYFSYRVVYAYYCI